MSGSVGGKVVVSGRVVVLDCVGGSDGVVETRVVVVVVGTRVVVVVVETRVVVVDVIFKISSGPGGCFH